MDEDERKKVRLALNIIAGMVDTDFLDDDEYTLLEYDTYKFAYYGKPSDTDIRRKAVNILYKAIAEKDDEA